MLDIAVLLVSNKSVLLALILSMVMVMKLAAIVLAEAFATTHLVCATALLDSSERDANIKQLFYKLS